MVAALGAKFARTVCGIVLEARRYDLIHRRSKSRAPIVEGVSFGRSSLAVLAAETSQITV